MDDNIRLAKSSFMRLGYNMYGDNVWSPDSVDKMETIDIDNYSEIVKDCRFFYRHDPIVSTVINKMVDIGINDIIIPKTNISQNEYRVLWSLKRDLLDFAENMALEYLISGLVVPEIKYGIVERSFLKGKGIKKYDSLLLPISMWIRDPLTIKINYSMVMGKPSYYVVVPDTLAHFIRNGGTYVDGTSDKNLFNELKTYYPDFVAQVKSGEKFIRLENDLIFRRRPLTDSPYPVPFLYPVIESLKHKRNLRRMDYSVASRAVSAIQLFKLGNDQYPVTEDQEDQFDSIREQMAWRYSGGTNTERIFQLFANHTLTIEWIYPPVDVLLNDRKYSEVNQDIIIGLGFPQILMTGETLRSATSQPEFAVISPIKTMENFRSKIIKVLQSVVDTIIKENNMRGDVTIRFRQINLNRFMDFVEGLTRLYDSGNISRTTFSEELGYNFDDEINLKSEENRAIESLGVEKFAPKPFSPQPESTNNTEN